MSKKNKEESKFLFTDNLKIFLVVLFVVGIIGCIVYNYSLNQEKFVIYEEVCENESYISYTYNKINITVDKFELTRDKIIFFKALNKAKEKMILNDIIDYHNDDTFSRIIEELGDNYLLEVSLRTVASADKEVCEPVEVGENVEICVDKYGDEGDALWCVMSDVININWIEKNCAKSYVSCEDFKKEEKRDTIHYTCKKKKEAHGYKCGDYIIEVTK